MWPTQERKNAGNILINILHFNNVELQSIIFIWEVPLKSEHHLVFGFSSLNFLSFLC